MIYPDNFEQKIKFLKVRQMVKQLCLSPMGEERVETMAFMTDYNAIVEHLGVTWEMYRVIQEEDDFTLTEFADIRDALSRIKIEGLYLEEDELASVGKILRQVRSVVKFFTAGENPKYPLMAKQSTDVMYFPVLMERIEAILDKYGRIKDNASPELAQIRRDILSKQSSVTKRMAAILKQAQADGIVESDVSIAVRDGRTVIPVPAANKRRLSGIVLDESSTGRTSFIEPTEVVMLNNELRELGYAERREIIKILTDVSNTMRPYLTDLLNSVDYLSYVDFVRAKAKYAISIEAIMPIVENRQGMYWSQARHPLLYAQLKNKGEKIVPLDIELESPMQRILIISGPNAGGKSVCLQTVGMLQYMMQCGMLVPMAEGSKMGLFDKIFIDMGDEQSIENDLSTYSSHLTNMKHFVRNASGRTLILIDEFGTGTEPMLGGAIAESVLAELNRREVFGVITTHYTNLKHFAAQTEGICNGAMLFDTHAIQPLFKLQMGQPGSSFAFEIARKIGLSESILSEAKEKMGQDHWDFDKHLREIVRDKRYWETKRQQVKENDKRLGDILERYQRELENVKKERKEILDKAKREAEALLAEANKKIENTIREIKEVQAEKERTKQLRSGLTEFKEKVTDNDNADNDTLERKISKIKERERRRAEKKQKSAEGATNNTSARTDNEASQKATLSVGDMVSIDNNAQHVGEILSISNKEAVVAVGNLRSTIKLSRLSVVSRNAVKKGQKSMVNVFVSNVGESVRERKLTFKPEVDVRGMRAEEALEKVAQFVDEAVICEQPRLSILHGKGNGILRQTIRQYLNTLPFVESVRDEHVQFGGAGITIVEIG